MNSKMYYSKKSEIEVIVISAEETAGMQTTDNTHKFAKIEFSETIFFPGGGGQPCDIGTVSNKKYGGNFEGRIIEIIKERAGLEGSRIIHKVEITSGTLHDITQGTKIFLKVDAERRAQLMAMHTGEHILFKALQKNLCRQNAMDDCEIILEKIDLSEKESRIFVTCQSLSWENLFEAERTANIIINYNLRVITREITKDEALRIPELRIKKDRIHSNTIRVVEIEGFDMSACTGLHTETTGEIETIIITGLSKTGGSGPGNHTAKAQDKYEIRFKVGPVAQEELFRMAQTARQSAAIFPTAVSDVPKLILGMKKDIDLLKKKAKELSAQAAQKTEETAIGSITLCHAIVDYADKKQLVDRAGAMAAENKIVLFINRTEEKAEALLIVPETISNSMGIKASELIKLTVVVGGKGGGRDNFASGSIPLDKCQEFLEIVKRTLREKTQHS